nr:hypothetical protein CFP56_09307 [Quercus suber]
MEREGARRVLEAVASAETPDLGGQHGRHAPEAEEARFRWYIHTIAVADDTLPSRLEMIASPPRCLAGAVSRATPTKPPFVPDSRRSFITAAIRGDFGGEIAVAARTV